MSGARFSAALTAVLLVAGLLPAPAGAIPVFARKYGVNCTMCHSSYPRLNDFGARFRANGYRMPGLVGVERTVLESPAPLALRTSAGYNVSQFPHREVDMALELNGLDVLSGGLLGQKVGYFLVFTPGIAGSKGVAAQDATLEMANVVFSGMANDKLTLRVGRFEPAYVAFSAKRSMSVAPYDVYGMISTNGPAFSTTQTGVEARYGGNGPVRAFAGILAGSPLNRPKDPPQDVYLRLEGVLEQGEGQTAGQRVGLVAYLGRTRPSEFFSVISGHDLRSFQRIGLDASLNWKVCDFAIQYLWAQDDGHLWGSGTAKTGSGGFVEATCTPSSRFTGFTRLDLVNPVLQNVIYGYTPVHGVVFSRATVGGRYHFEDNVAAHLEFSHRAGSAGLGLLEDFVTARLDMAF